MKSIFALAALAAAAGPLHAQSSVTLYGVVDAYAQVLDGSSRVGRVQSGGLNGSRLGFRGSEDLGGGLQAFFVLESGLNLDDGSIGQGGAFYGRQALVGLRNELGELSFGRQYSSLYTASTDLSVFPSPGVGPSTTLIGGFGGGYEPIRGAASAAAAPLAGATGNSGPARVNNSVRYLTPTWNGLSAALLWGAGEVTGATTDSRLVDASLRYRGHGFDVIASYIDDRAFNAGVTTTDATTATLAASYEIGPWRAVAGWLDFKDDRPAGEDGRGWWLGGEVRLGLHTLKAQYVRNEPRYGSDNRSEAFGVGWQYTLSRRTALYSSLTRFENDSQAGGGFGRFAAVLPAGVSTPGDNNVTEFVAGIRHSF